MSAEVLREAAALMRERAEAATPGPWSAADEHGLLGPDASPAWCVSNMRPGYKSMSPTEGYIGDVAETSLGFPEQRDRDNAEHIASWHPAVALAVADWLEFYAFTFESREAAKGDVPSVAVNPFALAVARAYLGSDS
jgi:hypothetical protein